MMDSFERWLRAPNRLLGALRALLLLQAAGFTFMVAGTHGAFTPQPEPPTTTDFASFYAAGVLADRGQAGLAYVPAAHRAAEAGVIAPGVEEKRFLNPPVFLLICAPLARLPYLVAFVLFEAATSLLWLVLVTRVAGGGALAALALACVPSVWWALGWGQNSFLSASLMAAATLLLPRRPVWAGMAFGALCFKPNFGVLIPVALLAGRQWRAVLGACFSAASLCALSVACFGPDAWRAFFDMASHARSTIETGIQLAGHVDAGGAARLIGVPAGWSWVFQTANTLLAGLAVAWLWSGLRREDSEHHRAVCNAALIAGTLASMPFVLFYDLVMAAVSAAWLARAARQDGWRRGEAATLAWLGALDLIAFPAASLLRLAVGSLVAPSLLWLSFRRRAVIPGPASRAPALAGRVPQQLHN